MASGNGWAPDPFPRPSTDEHGQPRKAMTSYGQPRSKTASCKECKRLKLKCSRTWPCAACVKRGCGHLCPDGVLKESRNKTKEIAQLTERVKQLEAALRRAGLDPATAVQSPAGTAHHSVSPGSSGTSQRAGSDADQQLALLTLKGEDESTFHGFSAAGSAFLEDAEAYDAYTSSSEDLSDTEALPPRQQRAVNHPSAFPLAGGFEIKYLRSLLPPRAQGEAFVKSFFDRVACCLMPMREDHAFSTYVVPAYDATEANAVHPHRLALLFAIMSIGALFMPNARDPRRDAHRYHCISQACIASSRFMTHTTLASVLTLMLSSRYYHCTHRNPADHSWPIVGLAVRLSLAMGLHRDGKLWGLEGVELEQRRAMWYECMFFDRAQALLLGRPYAIADSQFDTLPPSFDSLGSSSHIDFFQAKCKLTKFMGKVGDEVHGVNNATYETVTALSAEWQQLKSELPETLSHDAVFESAMQQVIAPTRDQAIQQHFTTVMYAETLISLHKSHFAQALLNNPDEPLESKYAASVVAVIVTACRDIITTVKSALDSYEALASRFMFAFHVFNAGICLALLLIRSPGSLLARFAWDLLCLGISNLLREAPHDMPTREFLPRLHKLRLTARTKLQEYQANRASSGTSTPSASHLQPMSSSDSKSAQEGDEAKYLSHGPKLARKVSSPHHLQSQHGGQRSGTGSPARLAYSASVSADNNEAEYKEISDSFAALSSHKSLLGIDQSILEKLFRADPTILARPTFRPALDSSPVEILPEVPEPIVSASDELAGNDFAPPDAPSWRDPFDTSGFATSLPAAPEIDESYFNFASYDQPSNAESGIGKGQFDLDSLMALLDDPAAANTQTGMQGVEVPFAHVRQDSRTRSNAFDDILRSIAS
ncbi:uncharacterized protein L969DRAFT_303565 [Mixia osmundae IAM 14324]|uniref:Zn(2)-C6 fungal-type domain-containing protein n=1 Tax=Mixia osmundae (strain CBS 9802 / IAM 14324 / JCM 22182 / KY 12970) TaxID=764103 RepID=G7DY29_MIXOS|nr:uncharacterized protein L969DRAFT_303565 [Mixia osmundae IAM 14324]KEI41391.1 hypothetical protein L969DRAFT_303565 [Mixia osmundae IAM 14324]GAA95489.1 hypothetical protein E5Q_02144 [Mixia osmundae IAM 14324]